MPKLYLNPLDWLDLIFFLLLNNFQNTAQEVLKLFNIFNW